MINNSKNYTDKSNVFAKLTINEFNILSTNYYTTNQASILGLTSQSIVNNTLTFPKSLNISESTYGGRPKYYMYTVESQVLCQDGAMWSSENYKITQIYLTLTHNSDDVLLTLNNNEIKSSTICSSVTDSGDCESRCCYSYYEFMENKLMKYTPT